MTEPTLNILIVDDNHDNCALLEDIFEDDYNVESVYSGPACLQALHAKPRDLVLLDINMPDMDGYEVCMRIKKDSDIAKTPVVFVSALASTEERLKGYECGAEGYVTKPFSCDDITETVTHILDERRRELAIELQSREAMSTAFQAMSNSAELGAIIQFMQASHQCPTLERLSECLLEKLSSFGLSCCVMFRLPFQQSYHGCVNGSIESKVLERFHDSERILDFGCRTLINDQHVSILVKNMPVDKPDEYGRIKDNLIALVSGTQARCESLKMEYKMNFQRRKSLGQIIDKSRGQLDEISALVSSQSKKTNQVLLSINHKVESIIFSLGLDEAQERSIIHAIESGIDELSELALFSEQIESGFKGFIEELERIAQM